MSITPMATLECFTGQQPVRRWIKKFEALAAANGWSNESMLAKLPSFFYGPALNWFNITFPQISQTSLSIAQPGTFVPSFASIKIAMVNEFENAEAFRLEMENRLQQVDENVQFYVYDKVHLCQTYDDEMRCLNLISYSTSMLVCYPT